MGLNDRDYMHERREPDLRFLRPRSSSWNGWGIKLLVFAAVLLLFFKSSEHLLAWKQARDAAASVRPSAPPLGDGSSPNLPSPFARRQPSTGTGRSEPVQPSTETRTFHKCVDARGRTSYTDAPCPSGSRSGQVRVDPAVNVVDAFPIAPEPQAAASDTPVAQTRVVVGQAASDSAAECAQLDQRIAVLDAYARQALQGYEQDRVRSERQQLRDRQFRIRCR